MLQEKKIFTNKPSDWPQNQREARVSNVFNAVKNFTKNPTYGNKEILLSLITELDPNQHDDIGLFRLTDYEVSLLNELYINACCICLGDLKIFLYKEVTEITRCFNMFSKIFSRSSNSNDIQKFSGLILPLRLYYITYQNFNYCKDRSFCEELIDSINICKALVKEDKMSLEDLDYAFTNLMFDLSCSSSINTIPNIEFNRDELLKLFKKEFEIFNQLSKNPLERPLKGILKMSISNWILKSRGCYDHSSVYKCLGNIASSNSIKNIEIWMQSIEFLNDQREGKVIKELFSNKQWIKHNWAKRIKLQNPYTFYVTSFSKVFPDPSLKHKYGKNVYGYRSDKIASNVSPLKNVGGFPQFSQVLAFDIIYNRDIAKNELNFLFEIIDSLHILDNNKILFANEVLPYWLLSFKDEKWKDEHERRYQIFYYDEYPYLDVAKDERFLKIKSSIFLYPDNISKDNYNFDKIRTNIFERYYTIATKSFIQCNDCLNIDYETYDSKDYICPICNSKNFTNIDPKIFRKSTLQ